VRSLWEAGLPVEGARAGADRYTQGCAEWGRQRLTGWSGADRTAELLGHVIDHADDSAMALFAGWRAQHRPDDAVGRAYLLIHVLRELRGGAHLIATLAAGLSPLESVLVNPSSAGGEQAKRFGWTEPFPDVSGREAAMAAAEATTDTLMARHLAVLNDDELAELATSIEAANRIVFGG
jgi:hypothetical protein